MKTTAELINVLLRAGYTRKEIAEKIGVSAPWVGMIGAGKGVPSTEVRKKLNDFVLKAAKEVKEREDALREAGMI